MIELYKSILKLVTLPIAWFLMFFPKEIDVLFLLMYIIIGITALTYSFFRKNENSQKEHTRFYLSYYEVLIVGLFSLIVSVMIERIGVRYFSSDEIGHVFESNRFSKEYTLDMKESNGDLISTVQIVIERDTEYDEMEGSYHLYYLRSVPVDDYSEEKLIDFICYKLSSVSWNECESIEGGNKIFVRIK